MDETQTRFRVDGADGEFYVYDAALFGAKVDGPFDTPDEAEQALTRRAQNAAGNPPVTFGTEGEAA